MKSRESMKMERKPQYIAKDGRKEGIGRVCQRPGDMEIGQGGKMGMKGSKESNFKRMGDCMTPRKA